MIKLKNISFKVDEDNDIYELIDLDTNFITSTNMEKHVNFLKPNKD